MKKFLKTFAYFSIAVVLFILILLASYIHYDPFKVVKEYHDYSFPYVITNRDYISTRMFLKYDRKYRYNSFIFGSSRTTAFSPYSWVKHLPNGSVPYIFDASSESIYGIDLKLKFLDERHIPMKNVLFIFCRDVTFIDARNPSGHLYIKDPLLSGQSKFAFQLTFFKAYTDLNFLWHFYDYKISKKFRPNMIGYIEYRKMKYDSVNNQQRILDQEEEITTNPKGYYARRKDYFYARYGERTDSIQRIHKAEEVMLKDIKNILDKNQSSYKIVLGPLYEQMKFNPNDLAILNKIFPGHIYDFTGVNGFTREITNYYESAHYRPTVGDSIMNIIYRDDRP